MVPVSTRMYPFCLILFFLLPRRYTSAAEIGSRTSIIIRRRFACFLLSLSGLHLGRRLPFWSEYQLIITVRSLSRREYILILNGSVRPFGRVGRRIQMITFGLGVIALRFSALLFRLDFLPLCLALAR